MKINVHNEFENTKKNITELEIAEIEKKMIFGNHYLIFNGGRPKKHILINEG